jgi:signal peptidase
MLKKEQLMPAIRDLIVSIAVVTLVLGALFAFSGLWPPMVVIESGSMQHSNTDSHLGVIDTGDLTVIRSSDKVDRIITWVEGQEEDYRRYGDFGDVIIFHKNGDHGTTPVIHRALVWIDLNETTGNSFDVPSMDLSDITVITFQNLSTYDSGVHVVTDLRVDLDMVLKNFDGVKEPHGGFLTKGDNNPNVDQVSLYMDNPTAPTTRRAEPVQEDWVIGVSRGELPWFGVMKLMFSDNVNGVPSNSIHNLLLTCSLLVVLPTMLDLMVVLVIPRLRARGGSKDAGTAGLGLPEAGMMGASDEVMGGEILSGEEPPDTP